MSEAVEANPYNAKKSWNKSEESPRGLLSPNSSLAYSDPTGEVLKDDPEATQSVKEETPEKEEATKYKKVDYKKRYDDGKRHYDKKLIEWKAKEKELNARINSTAPKAIPKTPEELATFKETYPDVYDVVESVAQTQAQEQLEKVKAEIAELREKEFESAAREAALVLRQLHPDFDEIAESDEFQEWAQSQHATIQDWIYDNPTDATLAARALDLYKRDAGILSDKKEVKKPKKKKEVDAAEAVLIKDSVDPNAGEAKVWTTSEIEQLSIQQYEEAAEELDLAFKEGRIVQG